MPRYCPDSKYCNRDCRGFECKFRDERKKDMIARAQAVESVRNIPLTVAIDHRDPSDSWKPGRDVT